MWGWILIGLFSVIGIALWIAFASTVRGDSDAWAAFWLGLVVLIAVTMVIGITYYEDTIIIPQKFLMLKETMRQTRGLIADEGLRLSDMEMNRELTTLIREKNQLLMRVRINNMSHWALYKIELN